MASQRSGWRRRPGGLRAQRDRPGRGRAWRDQGPGRRRGRRAVDHRDAALARGRLPGTGRGEGGSIMINTTRVEAVIRKELAEIRRNRLVLVTACILPVIFLVEPTVEILLI